MNEEAISSEDDEMIKLFQDITQSMDVTSKELEFLLDSRAQKRVNFTLIDIREIGEYSALSIKGTDMLLPTSTIHTQMDQLLKLKESFLIVYCRSGNRTWHMLQILRRMGFTKIAHLSRGIIEFNGQKAKNAPLPKNIK